MKKTTKVYEILNTINEEFSNSLKDSNPFESLATIPMNGNTMKYYTKFNRLHLSLLLKRKGYKTSKFMTFNQICAKGGAVITGQKSTSVFFSSWSYKFEFRGKPFSVTAFGETEAIELANKRMKTTSITKMNLKEKFCFTKYFNVFNLEQSEGIEYEEDTPMSIVNAEELIHSTDLTITETNGLSLYDEDTNTLHVPKIESDEIEEEYPEVFKCLAEHYVQNDLEYFEKQMITHLVSAFLSQACGFTKPSISIEDPVLIEKWLETLNESYYFLWRCSTAAQKIYDTLIENVEDVKSAA